MPDSMLSQYQLRVDFRKRRNALSRSEQETAKAKLSEQLNRFLILEQTTKVAVYIANDGEIDPSRFIDTLWALDMQVFLPVVDPGQSGHLMFVRYTQKSVMKLNKYNIPEPVYSASDICPVADLNIILTPLVAFDLSGNRLGMGGGYYDRTLAPVKDKGLPISIFGLAHQCQQTDALVQQSWDIPMQTIITDAQIIHPPSNH